MRFFIAERFIATDDHITTIFVLLVFGGLLLDWSIKKWKLEIKTSTEVTLDNQIDYIENYSMKFNYSDEGVLVRQKKVPLLSKVVIVTFCLLLVFTPFYGLVSVLKPISYYPSFICLPAY